MFREGPKCETVQQRTDRQMQNALALGLLFLMMWMWCGSAHAQIGGTINTDLDGAGPFGQILCSAVRWVINAIIPLAMVAFISIGAELIWGNEVKGIMKALLIGVLALTSVLSMIAVAAWIAGKFGFGNACSGVTAGF